MDKLVSLWASSGVAQLEAGQLVMMSVGMVLLYLAIRRGFEPLLLVPIGFGTVLVNIPGSGFDAVPIYDAMGQLETPGGLLYYIYHAGIETGLFPLIIFMGVGAMTDFSSLLANPKTLLLGAAAQVGIFSTVLGAVALGHFGILDFSIRDAASIGIIGGADGPTAIFVTSKLAPELLGAVAVAAYSYMALVPIIQPPIMRALTNEAERGIKMQQLRPVSTAERIIFPLLLLMLVAMLLPDAAPLLGMFCFGNLMRECGVVNRLSDTTQNALINSVTIFLGLGVGSKMSADQFLNAETLGILVSAQWPSV
jgi:oxaloacetate decarboxylase beta subunit